MPKKRYYETRQLQHPTIPNRKITLVYVDNELDLSSLSFLVAEARSGGRQNTISGKMTHIGRAYKIIELYRELDFLDLDWWNAEEEDIRIIRNRMLCWDMNDKEDYNYYNYEPIENDTMNQKLSVWMKFYKHQRTMGENTRMSLSTEMVKAWLPDAFLQHVSGTHHGERYKMVERWKLQVKSSPRKLYYPALSKLEFEAFRTQLRKIDIVYEAIALLMVSTGLRIDAALEFDMNAFQGWMKHITYGGKTIDDEIPVKYINKGGETKECELPIKTIHEIQGLYRANHYMKRLAKHELDWEGQSKPLWLREDGKKVLYRDVQKAFKEASKAMGRSHNNITPHHLRHSFATWLVIELSEQNKISLGIIGAEPHPMIMGELMRKLGHASNTSTLRYTMTAYKLVPKHNKKNGNMIVLTPLAIKENKAVQKLLIEKAFQEYGDDFDEKKYDMIRYAKKHQFAVDY
ncbi:MAG: site-specific integrase [Helicobacteraceae bacterium]|nr:site-specific integrase [Helicobacteraceae bacterium]